MQSFLNKPTETSSEHLALKENPYGQLDDGNPTRWSYDEYSSTALQAIKGDKMKHAHKTSQIIKQIKNLDTIDNDLKAKIDELDPEKSQRVIKHNYANRLLYNEGYKQLHLGALAPSTKDETL